jgi:predicted enzyme related to lactoylglutathione lyase
MTRFTRFELRTTDVAGARAFYAAVLGAEAARLGVVALPAEAAARGAPPHWLGHIGVDDVERVAAAFVARGAARLGPTRPSSAGGQVAVVRDPGGAVLALEAPPAETSDAVVWQVLSTADVARTAESYAALFGWTLGDRLDLGPLGDYHLFGWEAGGPSVGAMADVAGRPGVHPHWLVHFGVAALAPALAAVRAAGGEVITEAALPGGARVGVCHDPQGAIFALRG